MRKVDKEGRIVIPKELREKYGLLVGSDVKIVDNGMGITIKADESNCRMCNRKISNDAQIPLCHNCIEIVKAYNFNDNGI